MDMIFIVDLIQLYVIENKVITCETKGMIFLKFNCNFSKMYQRMIIKIRMIII